MDFEHRQITLEDGRIALIKDLPGKVDVRVSGAIAKVDIISKAKHDKLSEGLQRQTKSVDNKASKAGQP